MKVKSLTSVPVRHILIQGASYNHQEGDFLQCYDRIIAFRSSFGVFIYLDRENWDYSKTVGKYRNTFLGKTKEETQAKIDSGEYILTDLN